MINVSKWTNQELEHLRNMIDEELQKRNSFYTHGHVGELVDPAGLNPVASRRAGSTPAVATSEFQ